MSTDIPYAGGDGRVSPPTITPQYGSTGINQATDIAGARRTRCATGVKFITTIHGILNLVIIVALVCVIISAGVAKRQNTIDIDNAGADSRAKVSAFHTRNAVLVFACFGLICIIFDTVLHMTALINRLPAIFDTVFIIVMLVLGGIYLILGCCAAAWERKMKDNAYLVPEGYQHPGSAAAASFFLFVTMIAVIVNFTLRLIRPKAVDT